MPLGGGVRYVEDPKPKWRLTQIEAYKLKAGDFVGLSGWVDGHDPSFEMLVLWVQRGPETVLVEFEYPAVQYSYFKRNQMVKVVRSVSPPDVRADRKAEMNARLELNLLPYFHEYN